MGSPSRRVRVSCVAGTHRVWVGVVCAVAGMLVLAGEESRAASNLLAPAEDVSFKTVVEAETTARLLAVLLDSGRNVINENLLIAGPQSAGVNLSTSPAAGRAEGERALLGAPVLSPALTASLFERQLAETFLIRSGVDIRSLGSSRLSPRARTLLRQLTEMSKAVVTEAHAATASDAGPPSVHLIPAIFGSQVAKEFAKTTGVRLKQTAAVPRNPANAPDEFERWVLREFAEPGYQREKVIAEATAESKVLRLMFPLYATRHCLVCHGEPRGEIDQMGYVKEGLKLGQNAGAISVVIPMNP